MADRSQNLIKNRTDDRIIHIKLMEGENMLNGIGLIDNRLFNGGNKLHAKKADQGDMWYLAYEQGRVPGPLQTQFTTFSKCLEHVTKYFKTRNIEVTGVEDV